MLKDIVHIHFIGIGGYGMSALARVLLHLGYRVSGSDLKGSEITEKLAQQGAIFHLGHNEAHIGGAELVVYSTAIPGDNPELEAARAADIPLWHRSELLAHFLNARHSVAIAGAHGKTTTTSMTSLVLAKGGLDPTAFIGGVLADFDGNARLGDSDILVAEADESDNSFLRYRPQIAVVTNVEPDHLEHYNGDFNQLLDAYRAFLNNIKPGGCAILLANDPYLPQMYPAQVNCIVTFGLEEGADYRALETETDGWGTRFTVMHGEKRLGEITLKVPGIHNVLNALASLAVAEQFNIPFTTVKSALEEFRGTKRRFQFLVEQGGVAVVDDYAHHPTEVQATLKAASSGHNGRVIAVFQPHRYTRTQIFMDDFARSFEKADKVYLHKIYPAAENPIPGVTSAELAGRMHANGTDVTQIDDAAKLVDSVVNEARSGDLIITMGAGDITDIGHTIAGRLMQREDGR